MSQEAQINGIPGLEDLATPPDASPEVPREYARNGTHTLRNATAPQYVNLREKYEHRIIAYLKAGGNSNVEVARITGMSPAAINYLVRQEWMEQNILEEIRKRGDEAMQALWNAAPVAAETLVEIAKTAENLETKRKACNDILDRKYGKPNQPYSVKDAAAEDLQDSELVKIIQDAQAKN